MGALAPCTISAQDSTVVAPVLTSITRTSAAIVSSGAAARFQLTFTEGSSPVSGIDVLYTDPAGNPQYVLATLQTAKGVATWNMPRSWWNGLYTASSVIFLTSSGGVESYNRNGMIGPLPYPWISAPDFHGSPHLFNLAELDFLIDGKVPAIVNQPPDAQIMSGNSLLLGVGATGAGLRFQWYRGLAGNMSDPILGATGATCAIQPANNATYWVKVVNDAGSVDSRTVSVAVLSQNLDPLIVSSSADTSVYDGGSMQLSVTATGQAPLSYQWFIGVAGDTSQPIPGATTATYLASDLITATQYWVQVSNALGTAKSRTAAISVNPTIFSTQPADTAAAAGGYVEFSFEVRVPDGTASASLGLLMFKSGTDVTSRFVITDQHFGNYIAASLATVLTPVDIVVTPPLPATLVTVATAPVPPPNETFGTSEVHYTVRLYLFTAADAGTFTFEITNNGQRYPNTTSRPVQLLMKSAQTIAFAPLPAVTYGDPPFELSARASSGLEVSYAVSDPNVTFATTPVSVISSNPNVATVAGDILTIVGAGRTIITASQSGNADYLAAADVSQTLTVNKATATLTLGNLNATYDGKVHYATATTIPAGLSVTFTTPIYGTVAPPVLAGYYTFTFRISDNLYDGAATGTLVIAQASQAIAFGAPAAVTVGDAPFHLGATASSGLPVSYASSDSNVAWVIGDTVIVIGAGTASITASQPGDTNYNAAPDVVRTLTVNKKPQTVTFGPLVDRFLGDGPISVSATASSGLAPTYSIVSGPATINGSTVVPTGAGTVVVRATQQGDASYAAVTPVEQSFIVAPPSPYAGAYFGTFGSGGHWALYVRPNNTATYIAYLPSRHSAIAVSLTVGADGSFTANGIEIVPLTGAAASSLALVSPEAPAIRTAAAAAPFTLTGQIAMNGRITGQLASLGETLVGAIDTATGTPQATAGLYTAATLNSASGAAYAVVGLSGQAVAVITTPNAIDGAAGTVNASGKLNATTSNNAQLTFAFNATVQTASASLTPAGLTTPITYAGQSEIYMPVAGGHLVNLSSRAAVGTGDNALIVGFVITGSVPKPVIIRGIGPALAAAPFGIAGTLPDPVLDLYQSGGVMAHNDNWATAGDPLTVTSAMSRVGAFSLPAGSLDAVISTTLNPGVYSAIIYGNGVAATGVGMVEIYDSTPTLGPTTPRIVNISSRGLVGTGDNLLIGGFALTGDQPRQVLIRGVGPTLSTLGVTGMVLADPIISLYHNGTVINQNDNWGSAGDGTALSTAASAVGAFTLPTGSKDAALLTALQPGVYSVIVAGVGNTTGIALVEIYEVGN